MEDGVPSGAHRAIGLLSASVHCTIARIHDLGGSLGWGGFTTRSGCCTWCSVPRAERAEDEPHTRAQSCPATAPQQQLQGQQLGLPILV